MKKIALVLATAFVAAFLVSAPAQADDHDRAFQDGPQDRVTAKGVAPDRDITGFSFGITNEDSYQFFVDMKRAPDPRKISDKSYLELRLDTSNNGKANYFFRFTKFSSRKFAVPGELLDSKMRPVANCEVYQWVTKKSFGFSVPKSCIIKTGKRFQFQAVSTSTGKSFDFYPDNRKWVRLQTSYLEVLPCGAAQKDEQATYLSKKYICSRVGGKWKWADYGKVRGNSSPYLTERAYYRCGLDDSVKSIFVTLEDRGKSLTITTDSRFIFVTFDDLDCVYDVVGMPAAVRQKIGATNALSGLVEASWGKMSAFWTYRSGYGLDLTIYYD